MLLKLIKHAEVRMRKWIVETVGWVVDEEILRRELPVNIGGFFLDHVS